METKTFNIIKINRTWIAAKLGSYDCKIKVDDYTRNLELKEYDLTVNDISLRSKYGTDLRFEVVKEVSESNKKVMLDTTSAGFNKILYALCKKNAGKYESGLWIFPKFVRKEIEELDEIFNSEKIAIEVKFIDEFSRLCDEISLFGYTIAKATGRDSGAKVSENVAVIEGSFVSDGSMKNWATTAIEDTVVRFEVPKLLYEEWLKNEEYQKFDFKYRSYEDVIEIKIL